jgi:uncharacterized protein YkwD
MIRNAVAVAVRNLRESRCLEQGAIWLTLVSLLSACGLNVQDFPNLTPFGNPAVRSTPQIPAQSKTIGQMETQVEQQINKIREQKGLGSLRHNAKLAEVARRYSQRMANENFFSHTSPTGDTMVQRVGAAGIFYFSLGENLFMGTNLPQPVSIAVQGWMDSPGHRENILRPEYQQTGVGVWRKGNTYYFTQLFMRAM